MATLRHSSLWNRWTASVLTQEIFEDWLQINYPATIAREANGSYTSRHDNPRAWQITPNTLAEIAWLYLEGELDGLGGNTAAQNVQNYFSLSDHELLQITDIRDWIIAQGNATVQKTAWNTLKSWMNAIEQHGIESQSFIYAKFGIRADVELG